MSAIMRISILLFVHLQKEETKMADTPNAIPALKLVAIDIARYWKYVLVETIAGKRQRFKMANTAADFDRLIEFLSSLPRPCRVSLELTGDYHACVYEI